MAGYAIIDPAAPADLVAITDASGRVGDRTPAVELLVAAWKPGFGTARRRVLIGSMERLPRESRFDLRRPGEGLPPGPIRVELDLAPEASLTGQVRDGSGSPVEGAWVLVTEDLSARDQQPHVPVATRKTDATGHYSVKGLESGRAYTVHVSSPDGAFHALDRSFVAPSASADVALPACRLVVAATRSDGRPPGMISVVLERKQGDEWRRDHDLGSGTATDRGVVFDGLASGTARVLVCKLGLAPALSEPFQLDGPEVLVPVTLEEGRTITGRLVGPDGGWKGPERTTVAFAVEGCEGMFDACNVVVEKDGTFSLPNVPRAAGRLRVPVGVWSNWDTRLIDLPEGKTDAGEIKVAAKKDD